MDQLYSDYVYSVRVMKHLERSYPPKTSREIRNCLERYTISVLNEDPDAASKLFSELQQHVRSTAAREILIMATDTPHPQAKYPGCLIEDETIKCGELLTMITPERMSCLKKYDVDVVARATLRYAAMYPAGQQWSIPPSIYAKFYSIGFTIEGFASPFNCSMMILGGKYCSLYPEDPGSLGNFFKNDLAGGKIIVNPPFVEKILQKTATRCIELTKSHHSNHTGIVFYGPDWRDAEFYKTLSAVASPILTRQPFVEIHTCRVMSVNIVVFVLGEVDTDPIKKILGLS